MPCFLFSAVSSPWRRMDVQQSHETLSQAQRRTSILCIDRIINTLCVQTLETSNLIRAFNQKFKQCFFIATSCFSNALSRTGNQGIAILSIIGTTSPLLANYREPFYTTESWPRLPRYCFIGNARTRLLTSIVSAHVVCVVW